MTINDALKSCSQFTVIKKFKMIRILILAIVLLHSCKEKNNHNEPKQKETSTISTEDYELVKSSNSKALLIIFPGGGTTSKETKENFKIIEKAKESKISVLLMNFNRHFWIENEDSKELSNLITYAIKQNNLKTDNIFIGGMSIGGNVTLALSNYLSRTNSSIKPKGVFVVGLAN